MINGKCYICGEEGTCFTGQSSIKYNNLYLCRKHGNQWVKYSHKVFNGKLFSSILMWNRTFKKWLETEADEKVLFT